MNSSETKFLVKKAQRHDKDAFTELMQLYMKDMYREASKSPSLVVTGNGITIAPDTAIVDGRFAYMSFRVSGYSVEDGEESGFDMVDVYQGDDPDVDGSRINMYGGKRHQSHETGYRTFWLELW